MDIYFFTGTGNSFWAAEKLKELCEDSGHDYRVIAIDHLKRRDIGPAPDDSLFAFIYPTHGFFLPWHMMKFIFRFPSGSGRVSLINNRAGMKIGSKIYTPGLSGLAILFPMLVLLLKGYRISAVVPLDTPSNWISVHPGLRKKVIDSLFDRRALNLSQMWNRILVGKMYYPLKFFVLLPLDLLVSPVSLGYVFFGRFMLARTYLADHKCSGCGICADRCPVGAIKMIGKEPYWSYRCESCMRCSNICPDKAVNSSIPLTVLYTWLLIWIVSLDGPLEFLFDWLRQAPTALYVLSKYTIWWIIVFLGALLLYQLIWMLNRIAIFKRIFAFTTPMKFWRHYLAPGFRGKYSSLSGDKSATADSDGTSEPEREPI